jgi:hypothetical protein
MLNQKHATRKMMGALPLVPGVGESLEAHNLSIFWDTYLEEFDIENGGKIEKCLLDNIINYKNYLLDISSLISSENPLDLFKVEEVK